MTRMHNITFSKSIGGCKHICTTESYSMWLMLEYFSKSVVKAYLIALKQFELRQCSVV